MDDPPPGCSRMPPEEPLAMCRRDVPDDDDFACPNCTCCHSPAIANSTRPQINPPSTARPQHRHSHCRTLQPNSSWLCLLPLLLLLLSAIPAGRAASCATTNTIYSALAAGRSFTPVDPSSVPVHTVANGDGLSVCANTQTCCTAAMEAHLMNESANEFMRLTQDQLIRLRHTLNTNAHQMHSSMLELMSRSSAELNDLFNATYGGFYTRHSALFGRLFDNLTLFYDTGKPAVPTTLQTFFTELYQRMFIMLNPQHSLDARYATCMRHYERAARPFDDVPFKLGHQLQRSLVAARELHEALLFGKKLVSRIMKVRSGSECVQALMRMTYCQHCAAQNTARPCQTLCRNVAKGCLADHTDLDNDWNQYIGALSAVVDRVTGAFDVSDVVEGISVQISDAIMIFQSKSQQVKQQLVQGCGEPPMTSASPPVHSYRRHKRYALDSLQRLRGGSAGTGKPTSQINSLLHKVMQQMNGTASFWARLPISLCQALSVEEPAHCWNGTQAAPYVHEEVADGLVNQAANPEVRLSAVPNGVIVDMLLALRVHTARLLDANKGAGPGNSHWGGPALPVQHPNTAQKRSGFKLDRPSVNEHQWANRPTYNSEQADEVILEASGLGPSDHTYPDTAYPDNTYPDMEGSAAHPYRPDHLAQPRPYRPTLYQAVDKYPDLESLSRGMGRQRNRGRPGGRQQQQQSSRFPHQIVDDEDWLEGSGAAPETAVGNSFWQQPAVTVGTTTLAPPVNHNNYHPLLFTSTTSTTTTTSSTSAPPTTTPQYRVVVRPRTAPPAAGVDRGPQQGMTAWLSPTTTTSSSSSRTTTAPVTRQPQQTQLGGGGGAVGAGSSVTASCSLVVITATFFYTFMQR